MGSGLAHGAALVIAAEAHEGGDDGLHPDGRLVGFRPRARSELHPNGRLHGVGRSRQNHRAVGIAIVSVAMVSRAKGSVAMVRAACTELAA